MAALPTCARTLFIQNSVKNHKKLLLWAQTLLVSFWPTLEQHANILLLNKCYPDSSEREEEKNYLYHCSDSMFLK